MQLWAKRQRTNMLKGSIYHKLDQAPTIASVRRKRPRQRQRHSRDLSSLLLLSLGYSLLLSPAVLSFTLPAFDGSRGGETALRPYLSRSPLHMVQTFGAPSSSSSDLPPPSSSQTSSRTEGLSRYFQAILSRTRDRQRFVTGRYPVLVSIVDNPTQKWLDKEKATSLVLINDTTIDKSLASFDRFQWIDAAERQELHNRYASMSLELLAEVHIPKPGYVQILSRQGAGSSAERVRNNGLTTRWNRWQNSTLYEKVFVDEFSKPEPTTPMDWRQQDR